MDEKLRKIIEDLLLKYGRNLIVQIIAKAKAKDKVASQKLINSLEPQLASSIEQILMNVFAEDYFRYAYEDGRRKGKAPPLNNIKLWCQYRGIPKRAAWPIAQKIGRFGTPASNILSDTLNETGVELERQLEKEWAFIVENQLLEIVKTISA